MVVSYIECIWNKQFVSVTSFETYKYFPSVEFDIQKLIHKPIHFNLLFHSF